MSYGKVYEEYWDGEKIAALSDRAALLGLFLITGPHRNAIGCFRIGVGAISDIPRFGAWGIEGVCEALSDMSRTGFIVRDEASGWTLIVNALRKDPIRSAKVAIHALMLANRVPHNTNVYQELKEILELQLDHFSDTLSDREGWPMGTPIDTPSIPIRSPLPLTTNLKPEPEPQTSAAGAADFEIWYAAYPRHVARGAAEKAYRAARKKADAETLLAGIEVYRRTKPDYADWKHPATWLSGKCWLDESTSASNGQDTGPYQGEHNDDLHTDWRRLMRWQENGEWYDDWGPKPGEPGCLIAAEVMAEYGNGGAV
jgi:hypothetical protein